MRYKMDFECDDDDMDELMGALIDRLQGACDEQRQVLFGLIECVVAAGRTPMKDETSIALVADIAS
jgi:hypothetical protein